MTGLALCSATAAAAGVGQPSGFWPEARGDSAHSSSATLAQGGASSEGFDHVRLLWSQNFPVGNNPSGMGVSVGADGTVFTSEGGTVYALTASSGGVIWASTVTPADGYSQPALNDKGQVFVSSAGSVLAFSAATGALLWRTDILGQVVPVGVAGCGSFCSQVRLTQFLNEAPIIIDPSSSGPQSGQIYAMSYGDVSNSNVGPSGVVALDPATGVVKWGFGENLAVHGGAVSPDGSKFYLSESVGGGLYAYSTGGTLIGSGNLGINDFAFTRKYAVDAGGQLYTFCDSPRSLCSFTSTLSGRVWTATHPYTSIFGLATDAANARAYVLADGRLYGYDRTTGNTVLNLLIPGLSNAGPLTVAGKTIYFVGNNGLYNVDPLAGAIRWALPIKQDGTSGLTGNFNQVAVSSGVLYIHGNYSGGVDFVTAYASAPYTTSSVSSAPMTMAGSIRLTTVTVHIADSGGNAVANVPLAPPTISGTGFINSVGVAYTDLLGNATYQLKWDFSSLAHSAWPTINSTVTVQVPGLTAQSIPVQDTSASTFTVTYSTPSIEDNGTTIVQVTTFTFTVSNSTGGRVTNWPVALDVVNTPAGAGCSPGALGLLLTPTCGSPSFQVTNSTGQATWVLRLPFGGTSGFGFSPSSFITFISSLQSFALGIPPVTVIERENRSSTFTVTLSTPVIQSDLRATTMTVTVYDAFGSTVPNTIVALNSLNVFPNAARYVASFKGYNNYGCAIGPYVTGYTDASGKATFGLNITEASCAAPPAGFDTYTDFIGTFPVFALSVPVSSPTARFESNFLDHYGLAVPTTTAVGVSFVSTVTALNVYNHALPKYNETQVSLIPLFAGTNVQGTGTLGTSQITFAPSPGQVVINTENYNRVEDIQIKAVRNTGANTGLSSTIHLTGPDHFTVSVPTGAQAGVPFSMSIAAVTQTGQQVVGYAATLALSALQAGATTQAGAGILGVTNVNLPANGTVTIPNQTYTKAESIVVRVADSGAGVSGLSSSATISAGQPASLTLSANPQSTIATVPSVLTSTVLDLFSNPVAGSTVTFTILNGSGTVAASIGSLPSNAVSTNAVTNAAGQAQTFFVSTNTLSSQADLMQASVGGLTAYTTIYNAVLITPAGGTAANLGNPAFSATVPPNAYGFNVRMTVQANTELAASDVAVATAAMAKSPNTFVSSVTAKIIAVKDSSPSTSAGTASQLVTIQLPVSADGSNNVTVGARFRTSSLLVPLSVMRIFKLNNATSVFEMILDGTNLPSLSSRTVSAQVLDPNGLYALGAPPFAPVSNNSSGTVTTNLASGATVSVSVPAGAFASATNLQVAVPSAASVPALPTGKGFNGTGLTVSINTSDGQQPLMPIPVSIGYKDADIAGLDPNSLRLARFDAATGWVELNSTVDTAARQVSGTTDHFSLFQVVSVAAGDLSAGFVFPNPFRPSLGHRRVKFGNLPPAAHVKIYTVSGRLLQELDADTVGQILTWDGTDKNGRELASGVYIALVQSNGNSKTIKFAVQR